MPRRLAIGVVAVLVAVVATVAAAFSPWSHDATVPAPQKITLTSHAAPGAAPAATAGGSVFDTRESAQQAANDVGGRPGEVGAPSELVPLPARVFRRPIARWRAYALEQGEAVVRSAAATTAAIQAGDRTAARAAWTRAYAGYLRTGLAYGALGPLDDTIAASPGGLPRGTADPHFGGLHRVEEGLWTATPLTDVLPAARRLETEVRRLPRAIRTLDVAPLDYATRAHEILEDVQRDQLSGVAPQWSDAGVAATAAGLDATDRVMATLRPLLAGRGTGPHVVEARLAQLRDELDRVRRAHRGTWPPTPALTPAERERVQGSLGAALEALSSVPGELETARPPIVKPLP